MDTLLRGGRVIDPGTGTDRIADLHLRDGRVHDVGAGIVAPDGAVEIDAVGLIVGPGFVDLHSHVHSIAGQRLQAMDGVTTALDLEAGLMPVEAAVAHAEAEGRPLNFGFSASWAQARAAVHLDLPRRRTSTRRWSCWATRSGSAAPPPSSAEGGSGCSTRSSPPVRSASAC